MAHPARHQLRRADRHLPRQWRRASSTEKAVFANLGNPVLVAGRHIPRIGFLHCRTVLRESKNISGSGLLLVMHCQFESLRKQVSQHRTKLLSSGIRGHDGIQFKKIIIQPVRATNTCGVPDIKCLQQEDLQTNSRVANPAWIACARAAHRGQHSHHNSSIWQIAGCRFH